MFEFKLSRQPVDASECGSPMVDDGAGAFVTFEGWVRNRNDGRDVAALEYEAYVPLAEKEGQIIMAEAEAQFPIKAARCIHRVGPLELGNLAVWVGVTSEHRGAAFDACRYIIDAVKSRVPIWKRERYADGTQTWINAAPPGAGPSGPQFEQKQIGFLPRVP
jgi:molybdopterin synthase catalytic subunit